MAEQKDLLRIGRISSINYPNGTARVTYEDKDQSTTVEVAFTAYQYWMPKVGAQVLVGHLSSGTSSAVILGPIYHDGNRPVEGAPGVYRKEYSNTPGKAGERYDDTSGAYSQSIDGTADINCSGSWTAHAGDDTGAAIQMNPDGSITIIAPKGITISGGVTVYGKIEEK